MQARAKRHRVAAFDPEPARILVAGVDPITTTCLESALTALDGAIVRARTGWEVLHALAAGPFDLVIVDCFRVPEARHLAAAARTAGNATPFLILVDRDDDVEAALDGVTVLARPVDAFDLVASAHVLARNR